MVKLHRGQSKIFEEIFLPKCTLKRVLYPVVCCSRGWGKSYLAATVATNAIGELINLDPRVPHKHVYIIGPTHDQVIDIYYPLLKYDFGLEDYALKDSKDEGKFYFENNVELRLLSYESIERLRGKGMYLGVWDEVSSCKKGIKPKEAWDSVIKPTLITRWSKQRAKAFNAPAPGRMLFISTPKGFNYFQELSTFASVDDEWSFHHYNYKTSPLLVPEEIAKQKALMDPIEFASEYEADFKSSGNSVFYMFDRAIHVRKDLEDFRKNTDEEPGEDVHVCIDFNVGLMCSSAAAIRGLEKRIEFLEEFKGLPDTETLGALLKKRYIDEGHKVIAYPDPTGKARKTSAPIGQTDFSILERFGIEVRARSSSPPIVDSVQAVNRKLMTATKQVGIYVHSRCTGLAKSLERTKWVDNNPDIAVIDKSEGVEHFSDGVRYITEYLFPVVRTTRATGQGHVF